MSLRRLFAFVEVKTRNGDFSSTTGFPRAPFASSPKLALELVLRY
jgi:hypothetical protein